MDSVTFLIIQKVTFLFVLNRFVADNASYDKSSSSVAPPRASAACSPGRPETGTLLIGSTPASPTPPASRRLHPAGVFFRPRCADSTDAVAHRTDPCDRSE